MTSQLPKYSIITSDKDLNYLVAINNDKKYNFHYLRNDRVAVLRDCYEDGCCLQWRSFMTMGLILTSPGFWRWSENRDNSSKRRQNMLKSSSSNSFWQKSEKRISFDSRTDADTILHTKFYRISSPWSTVLLLWRKFSLHS